MNDSTVAVAAEMLARAAHRDQTDKAGNPYVTHLQRVAEACERDGGHDAEVAVAWLHDLIEDTDWTLVELVHLGFPIIVVRAISAITHLPNEPRKEYYARVRRDNIAWFVKIRDVEDNGSEARLVGLDDETADRLRMKYSEARAALA